MIYKDQFSLGDQIKVFGDQLAPFLFLVIMTPFNKVDMVHGIKIFLAPIGFVNHYDHQVVACLNDASVNGGIPKIIMISDDEVLDQNFYIAKHHGYHANGWFRRNSSTCSRE